MGKDESVKDGPQWEDDPDELDLLSYEGRLAQVITKCWGSLRQPNAVVSKQASEWIDQNQAHFAMLLLVFACNYNLEFGEDFINLDNAGYTEVGKKLNDLMYIESFVIPESE